MFGILFLVLCVAYLLLIPWTPSAPAALVKILPILMLVVRAASRASRSQRIFLALGLLFSLGGDAILALSPQALFILGVAAFLVAHVFYIITFRRDMRYSNRSAVLAVAVLAWCAAVGSVVLPYLGALRAPVVVYMVVIAAMGVSAAFASSSRLTIFVGASAFIVSDSTIAIDKFVAHFPFAPYLVMVTYYFGQFYIVKGVVEQASLYRIGEGAREPSTVSD